MPPKKKANGYCMFMQAERQRIQAETKQAPSMQEMADLCSKAWQNLSLDERARYNVQAKRGHGTVLEDRDMRRLDNQGHIIAERQNAVKEVSNRRIQENQLLTKSWAGQDVLDVPFYLVNFQVMYTEDAEGYFLPMEVGLVSFSLREGITRHLQHLIDPGSPPQGSMHVTLRHSENTHRIPLHLKEASHDYLSLWTEIEQFVVKDPHTGETPPIFCLTNERGIVESCLEFLHDNARSRESTIFTKIYTLEDLVMCLLLHSGKVNHKPSETQIQDSLVRSQWDYISSIRCAYHDELDCSHCSLAIVRRLSFSLFDMLADNLGFKLKASHMPDEASDSKFTVLVPTAQDPTNGRVGNRKPSHTQHRKDSSRSPQSRPFVAPPQSASSNHAPRRQWSISESSRIEVKQSDSDDTEDIKSTIDHYQLAELRKPKTPAAVLPHSVPTTGLAYGRGLSMPGDRAFPTRGVGDQIRHPVVMRPPPGFGPRPGVTAGPMLRPQNLTRPSLATPQAQPTRPPTNRGWELGRGRGRGMPPQI